MPIGGCDWTVWFEDMIREEGVVFLDGVAKGFDESGLRVGGGESLCFPLFLTGENGLKPGRGATTSTGRGLEIIREKLVFAAIFGGVIGG